MNNDPKAYPQCGKSSILDEDVYCFADGHKLKQQMYCDCGRLIWKHHEFCPKYGIRREKA